MLSGVNRRLVARPIAFRVTERDAGGTFSSATLVFIVVRLSIAFLVDAAVWGYWRPPGPRMQRARFPAEVGDHVRDASGGRRAAPLTAPLVEPARTHAVHAVRAKAPRRAAHEPNGVVRSLGGTRKAAGTFHVAAKPCPKRWRRCMRRARCFIGRGNLSRARGLGHPIGLSGASAAVRECSSHTLAVFPTGASFFPPRSEEGTVHSWKVIRARASSRARPVRCSRSHACIAASSCDCAAHLVKIVRLLHHALGG